MKERKVRVAGREYLPTIADGFSPEQIERFAERRQERLTRPDDELALKRLMLVYEHATEEEIQAGLAWYAEAQAFCEMLAEDPRVASTAHAAGIVSALSPRTSWVENKERAQMLVTKGDTYGTERSRSDANDILAGRSPDEVLCDPARSNFKTKAFYRNMAFPDMPDVTVDRHGFAMLFDDRQIGSVLLRPTARLYVWAESVFSDCADNVGLRPHEFQAVTWVVWRKGDLSRRVGQLAAPTLFDELDS